MPFGCTSTMGARHFAGRVSLPVMRAFPLGVIGAAGVVPTAVVASSAPQYNDALTVVTGPAVPLPAGGGITRPRTRTSKRPLRPISALPLRSTHGAPPAATPWRALSAGTLGASGVWKVTFAWWRPRLPL